MGVLMDKVAFVTGGSSGIGRAAVIRFAEEGAAVVIASRREGPHEGGLPTHEVIRRGGGTAEFVELDVTDGASVDLAMSQALERMGGLHVLVCSAGVLGPVGDSREIDAAAFDRHFAVNVRGTFLCVQRALKQFLPCGYGKVVTVSSNFGHVGVSGHAAYCASKAAVVGLTRALAVEYGPFGININCLCPGATKTAMNAHTRADPTIQARWRNMTPLRMEGDAYVAEPADIANAALFLASDASRFMHGACLIVDGGWMAG
jgi:NAD(P)-dependent dehydrogenase (short-subunit alcohol dehydrogenase family)